MKINHKTLRHEVVEVLRKQILNGTFKPGEKLVESELSKTFGVSRGPIREALRQLEQDGLIEYSSFIGCSVKALSVEDTYEIYLLRASLEILAVRECKGKFCDQTIAHLQKLLEIMKANSQTENFDEIIESDNTFHSLIVKEAGLNRLYSVWSNLNGANFAVFYVGNADKSKAVSRQYQIHQPLLAHIISGNQQDICDAILAHYMLTIHRLTGKENN